MGEHYPCSQQPRTQRDTGIDGARTDPTASRSILYDYWNGPLIAFTRTCRVSATDCFPSSANRTRRVGVSCSVICECSPRNAALAARRRDRCAQCVSINGVDNAPALIELAVCFGALHAWLPGDGNSVLASYYAGDEQSLRVLGSFRTSLSRSGITPMLTRSTICTRHGRKGRFENAEHRGCPQVGFAKSVLSFRHTGPDHIQKDGPRFLATRLLRF